MTDNQTEITPKMLSSVMISSGDDSNPIRTISFTSANDNRLITIFDQSRLVDCQTVSIEVTNRDGSSKVLELTTADFDMICYLMHKPGLFAELNKNRNK